MFNGLKGRGLMIRGLFGKGTCLLFDAGTDVIVNDGSVCILIS